MVTAPSRPWDETKHPRDWRGEFARVPGIRNPAGALTAGTRMSMRDVPDHDPLWAKLDTRLAAARTGVRGHQGELRRPALPPYAEAVTRCADTIVAAIAKQNTLEAGRGWYPAEHARAQRRAVAYHVPLERAVAVESATSPRCSYTRNQKVTNEILDAAPRLGKTATEIKDLFGGGILSQIRDQGIDLALGASIEKTLTGPKRRAFYDNIMWPGKTDQVTVDTWMLTALTDALGLTPEQSKALATERLGPIDGIGLMLAADATRTAAARLGVTPDVAQAAYWIAAMHAAGQVSPRQAPAATAAGGTDYDLLDDDQYDAELLIEYLTWLAKPITGRSNLGPPASARLQGGPADANPAAWALVQADPRYRALHLDLATAQHAARTGTPLPASAATGGDPVPYKLRGDYPGCDGTAVVNATTGKLVPGGCHPTRGKALAHLRALIANVPDAADQDLALTLTFPDAPGGTMTTGATWSIDAREWHEELHPREHGRFVKKGTPTSPGKSAPATPGKAPAVPGVAHKAPGVLSPEHITAFGNSVDQAEADLTRAEHGAGVSPEIRREMEAVIAELRAGQQRMLAEEKAKKDDEEKAKSRRKLIHHIITVIAAAVLTLLATQMAAAPLLLVLASLGPFALQEAADFIKKV